MRSHFPTLSKYFPFFILAVSFSAGAIVGSARTHFSFSQTTSSSPVASILSASENWGLSFQEEGKRPVGNATIQELAEYHAFFAADTAEKKLYLTFDCGYENGNTPAILTALKKHQAEDSFQKELQGVEKIYKETTGKEMEKFYRPPQGIYSTENLAMAKELGYSTFFWSLAYVDWIQDQQPSREEALSKLLTRVHPGAIVLLHNTSSTNGIILDELLSKWEKMGYSFHSVKELTGA